MKTRSHILVVDDEVGPRESLKIILKPEFEVTATARGSAALELLQTGRFEVVLLDLTMPDDLSGTETLRAIRGTGIDVEVIVITGQGALDTAVECLRLGARDYIAKPYRADDVRAAVRSALAARSARQRASQMREHLLGNLSHEFRTPLNAIVGYSEILHDEANEILSLDQRQALAKIQLNSERLLSYLEGLFFLAELDSGDFPSTPRRFAVRPWLERLFQPIRREAEQSGTAVEVDCDPALTAHTHPETLARLLSALTYATAEPCATGTLRISAEATSEGMLAISIEPRGAMLEEADAVTPASRDEAALRDPLAREVIRRAADTLDAQVTTESKGSVVLRVTVLVPYLRPAAPSMTVFPDAASASER